jgi:hypothetical protein
VNRNDALSSQGCLLSIETLQKHTIKEIVEKYRGQESTKKGSAATMTAAMIVASTIFKYARVIFLNTIVRVYDNFLS